MELESLDLAREDFGVLEHLIALADQGLRLGFEPRLRLLRASARASARRCLT